MTAKNKNNKNIYFEHEFILIIGENKTSN